jgi:hypothetical protein
VQKNTGSPCEDRDTVHDPVLRTLALQRRPHHIQFRPLSICGLACARPPPAADGFTALGKPDGYRYHCLTGNFRLRYRVLWAGLVANHTSISGRRSARNVACS